MENDIVLQDILVSQYHAEILFQDGAYFLRDLNSASGTYLNNQRIAIKELFSNDLIPIANIPILFTI
ncbi:FHA domain-containing protein [bacterium]|nr:FHA domain-containing protein [bacterium]